MQAHSKVLGAIGIIALAVGLSIGHSRQASGEPDASEPSPTTTVGIAAEQLHDPLQPYDPGPGAIQYEQLGPNDRAGFDVMEEIIETSQTDRSYAAFATATDWSGAEAETQIAARAVGLDGAVTDGVVP